jgi:hypothetical protein
MISQDKIDEIRHDEMMGELEQEGLNLFLFANSPISEIVDPDFFYKENSEPRHALKFLKFIKDDPIISSEGLRHARGFE